MVQFPESEPQVVCNYEGWEQDSYEDFPVQTLPECEYTLEMGNGMRCAVKPDSVHKNFRIEFTRTSKDIDNGMVYTQLLQDEKARKIADEKSSICDQIMELTTLEENWDGYGALKVFEGCIQNALCAIQTDGLSCKYVTGVYPSPNGTVSIDWDHGDNRISAEFGLNSFTYYVIHNGRTVFGPEQPVSSDNLKQLAQYARNL
jgi:hypothetical protein